MSQEPDQTESVSESPVISSAEELRRQAAQYLIDHLEISSSLMARCEALAYQAEGDRTSPLFAAARIMRVSADTARALGQVANGETRHRSIIEKVETYKAPPPDPVGADLDATMLILSGRLRRLAEETQDYRGTAPTHDRDVKRTWSD